MPIINGVRILQSAPNYVAKCKELGYCYDCAKRPAVRGRSRCRECLDRSNAKHKRHKKDNPEYKKYSIMYSRKDRLKRKLKVLDYYGNRICKACGETDIVCLTIDHVNNDGAAERKKLNKGACLAAGNKFYNYLIQNNFPDKERYQVLCHNCQFRKRSAFYNNQEFKSAIDFSTIKTYSLVEYSNLNKE